MLAGVIKIFKMAEADKARRDTGNHRSGFLLLAVHRIVAADNRQRAGGRNAQAVHRFGTQIFANAGTQHRPAVGKARKRRFTRPFELPFPAVTLFILSFTQHQRATIAQLRGIAAKLMAAVNRGKRRGIVLLGAAAQVVQQAVVPIVCRQALLLTQRQIPRHPIRLAQRIGGDIAVKRFGQAGESGGG